MDKFDNKDIDWKITQLETGKNVVKEYVLEKAKSFDYLGADFDKWNKTNEDLDMKLERMGMPCNLSGFKMGEYLTSDRVSGFIGMPKQVGDGRIGVTKNIKPVENDMEIEKR